MTTQLADPVSEDVLERIAGVPAFVIDRHDRIIYWNEGASRLLGHTANQVLGRFCFDALGGRDIFGNRYCVAECPMVQSVAEGEEPHPFLIQAETREHEKKTLTVHAVPFPHAGPDFEVLIHILTADPGEALGTLVSRVREACRPQAGRRPLEVVTISVCPLSARETEILELLASGYAALNISARLDLSHATVRNHIQNILRKLDVHSQVEAIALSFRRGWLTA